MTAKEQHVYNAWLIVTKTHSNQPFRIRTDFKNFDSEKYVAVQKINHILEKYSFINIHDFFRASYEFYDEEYLPLNFFYSSKALKAYRLYKEKKEMESADSEFNVTGVISSLKFIKNYCVDNDISVDKYIHQMDGYVPVFFNHLKNHNVSVYCLLSFDNFEDKFKAIDKDILNMAFNENILNKLARMKIQYLKSNKCKLIGKKGIEKLKKI